MARSYLLVALMKKAWRLELFDAFSTALSKDEPMRNDAALTAARSVGEEDLTRVSCYCHLLLFLLQPNS